MTDPGATRTRRSVLKVFLAGTMLGPLAHLLGGLGTRVWAQVNRTIRMPPRARREPLPEGSWLATYREMITRSGDWRRLDTGASQKAVVQGGIRVIGSTDGVPANRLLGYGDLEGGPGSLSCAANVCTALLAATTCDKQICTNQNCTENECTGQVCAGQECPGNICNGQRSGLMDFVSEIESQWTHPFVQALRRQLRVDSAGDLAGAVNRFVGQNGSAGQ